MNILALDLGTKTGWASYTRYPTSGHSTAGNTMSVTYSQVFHGVQDFSLKRGESSGMRYIRFQAWLQQMFNSVRYDLVVYEMPHLRGGAAAEVLTGFSTVVQMLCSAQSVQYSSVHSATLKKFATGTGRADKAVMIQQANSFRGYSGVIKDDNEADAVCLLEYARKELNTKPVV